MPAIVSPARRSAPPSPHPSTAASSAIYVGHVGVDATPVRFRRRDLVGWSRAPCRRRDRALHAGAGPGEAQRTARPIGAAAVTPPRCHRSSSSCSGRTALCLVHHVALSPITDSSARFLRWRAAPRQCFLVGARQPNRRRPPGLLSLPSSARRRGHQQSPSSAPEKAERWPRCAEVSCRPPC